MYMRLTQIRTISRVECLSSAGTYISMADVLLYGGYFSKEPTQVESSIP